MKAARALAVPVVIAALVAASPALAEDEPPEPLFAKAVAALDKGAYQEAVDDFEALADRGFVHPDASFNRGLAYLGRVRAQADKPGDLGRAAAAFEEALVLRPDDEVAARELDLVRREVTRRRARRGKDEVDARPTIDRAIVGLLGEGTWAAFAIVASTLFALGLVLRRVPRGPLHVTGSVLAPASLAALLLLVPAAVEARWLAAQTKTGVVVVPEIALADAQGIPIAGVWIPEAASLELGRHEGVLVHARWGSREGWVPLASVRVMP